MFKNVKIGFVLIGSLIPLLTQASSLPNIISPTAILAGTTVTNAGASTVRGDVDVSPGTSITGFPPGVILNGQQRPGTIAAEVHASTNSYYNTLVAEPCSPSNNLTGKDLGGMTLAPGVYCFNSDAMLNGTLILNGPVGSTYTFQIASTLITGTNSLVKTTNSVQAIDINWVVGSSATLGTNTTFKGNLIALTSITIGSGAEINGRALAINGAVTLDNNFVSVYK